MKNYNKGEKVSIKRCYEVHINGYITDVCPGEVGTVHWDCGDTVEVYFGDYIMLEVNKEDIEPCISKEAEEVTIDGWVSVYERMPDKNGRYLVCTDKGQIRDCYYQLTQNGGWWRWPGSKVPSITHWMKQPKLPIQRHHHP